MKIAALAFALSGCAVTPYTVPPHLNQVTLNVKWTPEGRTPCGPDAIGCGTITPAGLRMATIWVPKPTGFDDPMVCTVGHEVLHALGARH